MLGETLNPAHLAALVKITLESRFRRFHLNELMLDGAWLPTGAWDARRQPFTIPDSVEVVLGFDGSFNERRWSWSRSTASGRISSCPSFGNLTAGKC